LTIGLHGSPWTVETARDNARMLRGVIAAGGDPAHERERLKQIPTFEAFAQRYLAEHAGLMRKGSTAKEYARTVRNHLLPAFGSRQLHAIDAASIRRWHARFSERPYAGNRALALLSAMLAWAMKQQIIPTVPNPCRHVEKFPEAAREKFLEGDELRRLGAAIREAETDGIPWETSALRSSKHTPKRPESQRTKIEADTAAALRLLVFTGARLREILHLRWEDVDVQRGALFLKHSKSGKKTIQLNAAAARVLATIPRVGAYVFPGRTSVPGCERPRDNLNHAWHTIRRRAGLPTLRLHDLRHTFASEGVAVGLSLRTVGVLLGHSNASTTQRYAHLGDEPLRRATELIGANIEAALGEGNSAEVVPLIPATAVRATA
jgi:integrase